jgi:hypothetical protein
MPEIEARAKTKSKPPSSQRRALHFRPTREMLLAEFNALPDESFTSSAHASAYIGTSQQVLANWRSNRRGPEFVTDGEKFVRYKVGSLRAFMADRVKATVGL